MKLIRSSILLLSLIGAGIGSYAQTLPVGTPVLEDYYRRAQLQGYVDTNVSFTVRPLFPNIIKKNAAAFYPDSTERRYNLMNADAYWQSKNKKAEAGLLPLSVQAQFNSHHPYGWNDGPMIPAKGLQTVFSAGFFAKYGPLSVQFRPEFVMASNDRFETFDKRHYEVIFARYYDIYNNIDLPARFGPSGYFKAFWGQSSVRLNYKALSFGLSTENLWWGPGIRNSLLMSNTAPGFGHFTLNTTKPIHTGVGSFEGQIIAGWPKESGFMPLTPDATYFGTSLYVPKPKNYRYLTGFVVTWQPKWVPGLFLGYNQSSQMYGKDLDGIGDYLPFFWPVKKVTAPDNPISKKDQRSSAFVRWLWTKEQAELYFEWGHNNNTNDFQQTLLQPGRSRAYTFGLRKLMPFNRLRREDLLIGLEVTQLQETSLDNITQGYEWYVNKYIRQGYTNRGEVVGAGIGPGGNIQSVDISWVKGLKKIGLQLERYAHNNDFYYYAYVDSYDFRRHWVDLSIGLNGSWNYKNLVFNTLVQGIKSINYQWYLEPPKPGDFLFVNGTTKYNMHIQAGVAYRF